jgi:Mu-like prophage protein gpG
MALEITISDKQVKDLLANLQDLDLAPISAAAAEGAARMGARAFREEALRPAPWEPLAPSTMRQVNRGFDKKKSKLSKKKQETANFIKNPLIDTGAMMRFLRAFEIGERAPDGGYIASIASDRPYAAFHQFGTKHIPARPFLPIDANLTAGTATLTDKAWNTLKPTLERILKRLISPAP